MNPAITTIGRHTVTLADLLPAAGIVLGALLPWLRGGVGRSTAFNTPLAFLVDTTAQQSPVSIGALLAVLSLVAAAAPARALRLFAYAVALAVFAGYLVQLGRLLHQAQAGVGVGSVLGAGVYVGGAAAVLGLGWTLAASRQVRR